MAVQNVQDVENIVKDPNKNDANSLLHQNGNDPYKHFVIVALLTIVTSFTFLCFHASRESRVLVAVLRVCDLPFSLSTSSCPRV